MADKKMISQWKGINNVGDPHRLGMEWLSSADNVDVTDDGKLKLRPGFTTHVALADASNTYATKDGRRMYVLAAGVMYQVNPLTSDLKIIATVVGTGPAYWSEFNGDVLFNNGDDDLIIRSDGSVKKIRWEELPPPALSLATGSMPAGTYQVRFTRVLSDGRETGAGPASSIVMPDGCALSIAQIPVDPAGASLTKIYVAPANSTVFQALRTTLNASMVWDGSPNDLGEDLRLADAFPLPYGSTSIQVWGGRMYASQYLPTEDISVIWASEPLGIHLFKLGSEYFMVPGKVEMLAAHKEALLIGTDRSIHAWNGESMAEVADFGVPPGNPFVSDMESGDVFIWTSRGVCAAMPWRNLTKDFVSFPPGKFANLSLVHIGGEKKLIVSIVDGGTAFNAN